MTKTWLIVALLGLAAPVFAEPPGATPPSEPVTTSPTIDTSYRLQIVAVDAGVVAALALGSATHTTGGLALLTYLAGAPIVHLIHDQPGSALASAGLRVGLPVIGAVLGSSIGRASNHPDSDATIAGAALGAVIGVVAASALDIGVLAKHESRAKVGPAIAPSAHGGMTFGVAGSF